MTEEKIEQNKPQEQLQAEQPKPIKPDILDYDDVRKAVPFLPARHG